jgi:hypothetical protein
MGDRPRDEESRHVRQALSTIDTRSLGEAHNEALALEAAAELTRAVIQRIPDHLLETDAVVTGVLVIILVSQFSKHCGSEEANAATVIDLVGLKEVAAVMPTAVDRHKALSKTHSRNLLALRRASDRWMQEPTKGSLDEIVYRFRAMRRHLHRHG